MNVERIISEYENELTSLKIALSLTDQKDTARRLRLSEQIVEMEELIKELNEKIKSQKNILKDD